MNESQVFADALKLATPAERAAYLDAACAGNPQFRADVEALLQAQASDPGFLEQPPGSLGGTADVLPAGDSPIDQRAAGFIPAESPGVVLASRYKLLEAIGEGGMGTVWMAQQFEPVKRLVAVKLIKLGMDSKAVLARFEAERQALALMDHPNIAKVLDGGATADGRPYFVMELVKGVPITTYCDEHRLTPNDRLRLFADVCRAVQHAHQKGVIHRDLKPSNILVAPYDGRPVVKVIDFGVAKAAGQPLTERTLFTGLGAVVGTLEYMSPEQAELNNQDIDTRSDVYSLGVLLYELLTGTTPLTTKRVKGAALLDVLRLVREEEPPTPSTRLSAADTLPTIAASRGLEPRQLSKLVRGELDWIVMRTLEKDRGCRYETANALALDVDRYLADEPVLACPPSAGYRFRKFARRHRVALAMAGVVAGSLVVLVGVLVGSTVLVWRANRDLQQALAREQDITYFQRIALAERELAAIRGTRAEELLDQCLPGQRGWEWHFLKRRLLEEPLTPEGRLRSVGGVAFSSNGRLLASADYDGALHLWDPISGACLRTLTADPRLARVAISRDGQRCAAARWNGPITVWDLAADQQRLLPGQFKGVAFSPDGRHLASGDREGAVIVWDLNTWEKSSLSGHADIVHEVAYSPDGMRLASVSEDQSVRVWDVHTGRALLILRGHQDSVYCLAFSWDGQYLATGSQDRTVRIWNAATGDELQVLRGHNGPLAAVAFSPDGRRLASGADDQTVRLWDPMSGQEALTLREFTRNVRALAFSPDGLRLAVGGHGRGDVPLRIWNATPLTEEGSPEPLRAFSGHVRAALCVAFSSDGRLLASGGDDKTVRVRDASTGQMIYSLDGQIMITAADFSPDGTHLAACGENGTLKIWDRRTGSAVLTLRASPHSLGDVKYSPDGHRLALADAEGMIRILDVRTKKELEHLNGQVATINVVAFSPDGQFIASGGDDGSVRLWNVVAKKQVQALPGHQAGVWGVAYPPDGKHLVTAGKDGLVIQWDLTTGTATRRIQAHRDAINAMQLSPDGRCLASASADGTVKFWDTTTGGLLGRVRAHRQEIYGVAFHPDGKQLASADADGIVRIWAVPPLAAPTPAK